MATHSKFKRGQNLIQPLPTVAVCLAAFNGTRWLTEQLTSILGQAGVSVTVFVSVDRSSDGTEEWIDQWATKDMRIVVLPHGERFGGAARNFFRLLRDADFSGFDYISFADQDDVWFTDKLVRAHEVLLRTGADAYSSNIVAFWPSGRRALIKKSQPQRRWDFLFEAAGPGCTYVMKAGLARAIQALLRERWGDIQEVGLHDWFAYAFARANGYRWVIDEHAGLLYRQHEKNQVGVNAGWRAFMHRARNILNGWGLTQAILIAQLVGLGDDPFVKRWLGGGRGGLLWLALRAGQCRRRVRDRVLFALSCVALCVAGSHER
ncbi:MAG: glycosyltransferase [Pseudomonadota bacterium]